MILYFSGTGNSRLVALQLSELLGDEAIRLVYPFSVSFPGEGNRRLIWVFPVYSWGIPPVVRQVIREIILPRQDMEHFLVCTCGDDVGLLAREWRSEIRKRGWRAVGCWSVQMPNTYVTLPGFDTDAPLVESEKLHGCRNRLEAVARGIRHSARVDDMVRGSLAWLKSRVIKPFFVRFLMSPKPFGSDENCIGCGLCERYCPMQNVRMENGRPQWGNRCAFCLACYHCCPRHAVYYGKQTKSKGQYLAPMRLPD